AIRQTQGPRCRFSDTTTHSVARVARTEPHRLSDSVPTQAKRTSQQGEFVSTTSMKRRRSAGILLHPTSLPGPYGIGDLGPVAYGWVDGLAHARQTWWQVLPLGPTGFGDSPYQCLSALAGNPYLISPEELARDGLLSWDAAKPPGLPDDRVDYGRV